MLSVDTYEVNAQPAHRLDSHPMTHDGPGANMFGLFASYLEGTGPGGGWRASH